MEIFWRLMFGHLLADFTFQTNFINRWKRSRFAGLLVHSLMHPFFYAVLCRPFLDARWIDNPFIRMNGWACIAVIFVTHLLEDWWRVYAINNYGMPDNTAFLAWDQVIHYSVIFAVVPLTLEGGGLFPEKWPVLGCLLVLVTHTCTIFLYFLEKDMHGASFPGFDEKYLGMTLRLVLALLLLLPNASAALAVAAAWLVLIGWLRKRRIFDMSGFSFYGGAAFSILCGLAARAIYY